MSLITNCSEEKGLFCSMFIAFLIVVFTVFLINTYCFVRVFGIQKKFTHEMITLFLCALKCVLLSIYVLIFMNIYISFAAFYIEILVFSSVNYILVKGYFLLGQKERKKEYNKRVTLPFIGFFVINTIVFISAMFGFPDFNCENRYGFSWLILSISSFAISLSSLIFGTLLLKKKKQKNKNCSLTDSFLEITQNESFFNDQKHIIILLLVTLITTTIVNFVFDLSTKNSLEVTEDIECVSNSQIYLETAKSKYYLIIRSIIQIFPICMLPYTFYYVQFVKARRFKSNDNDEINFSKYKISQNTFGSTMDFEKIQKHLNVTTNKTSYIPKASYSDEINYETIYEKINEGNKDKISFLSNSTDFNDEKKI